MIFSAFFTTGYTVDVILGCLLISIRITAGEMIIFIVRSEKD